MAIIWIGDFRCRQLQQHHETLNNVTDNIYIIEDTGECSWFTTGVHEQLSQLSVTNADAIITLGFNDCVYSCVWKTFDIEKIAANYAKNINTLIEQYPSIKFYVCSVNPIDADYPFAEYSVDGIITHKILTKKIEQFNSTIKSACKAAYIDTYNYLTSTNFYTHDGVFFDTNTIADINSYIFISTAQSSQALFVPRLTAPVVDASISGEYWLGDSYGGLNPFDNLGQSYAKVDGDTLPNCTAYAWGRFYEILGSRPTLSTGNAEQWYLKSSDGYTRGQEPALGAIICWQGGATTLPDGNDGAGHVAIVEQINADGSIVTSESGWNSSSYWWTKTRTKGADNNWGQGSSFKFQGFIYCPTMTSGKVQDFVDKSLVVTKNSYLSKAEMRINARYIWNFFGTRGWSLNAVAGMLGNMQTESTITPNLCERSKKVSGPSAEYPTAEDIKSYANRYLAAHGRFPGYGLVQWTGQWSSSLPYTWENQKYIYWCNQRGLDPADIDSQLERIIWECENGVQFGYTSTYPMTFKEFSTSTQSADYLAKVFLRNYERPANPDYETRGRQGMEWYNFLLPYAPTTSYTFMLDNLKVDKITPTSVNLSFITQNITKGNYELFDNDDRSVSTGDISIAADAEGSILKVVTFRCTKLIPNTLYKLRVIITGDTTTDTITKIITFETPQSHPEPIHSIKILAKDSILPHDSFQLAATPNKASLDWGYWKSNNHGYTIQLIVNGQIQHEKNVSSLITTFKLSDYFKYNVKLGDTVQIGIKTWVIDNNGKKVFNTDSTKCSNAICMLARPVTPYLNKY